MKIERFELRCFCRHPDGKVTPYHVVVEEPFQVTPDEWVCPLKCSAVKGPPVKVHGGDREQAYALAYEFLHIGLENPDLFLEDDQGRPITLPRYREFKLGRIGAPGGTF